MAGYYQGVSQIFELNHILGQLFALAAESNANICM